MAPGSPTGIGRFVAGHGRRGLARGAVVVVLSDGWATDEPEEVAEAMRRLRRLAHRVVWVNPRKAAPGYAPLVGGMAGAPSATLLRDAFVERDTGLRGPSEQVGRRGPSGVA